MVHLPEDDAIRAVLDALGRDEYLSEGYVLKGGNALRYAFFGRRASVDLDLSAKTIHREQIREETEPLFPRRRLRVRILPSERSLPQEAVSWAGVCTS